MLPINIYTFVHDTVMLKNEEHLKGMFFTLFTPELSDITKRPVNVEFIYDTPGMTDFDYLSYATRYPNLDDYIGLISADINHAVDAYRAAQQRTAKATDIYLILIDATYPLRRGSKAWPCRNPTSLSPLPWAALSWLMK